MPPSSMDVPPSSMMMVDVDAGVEDGGDGDGGEALDGGDGGPMLPGIPTGPAWVYIDDEAQGCSAAPPLELVGLIALAAFLRRRRR